MALYQRSGPLGVDIPIAGLQKFLYNGLQSLWVSGVPTDGLPFDSYDRVYKELTDIGYIPKLPKQNTLGVLEYAAMGFDTETNSAISFCSIGDRVKHDWKTGGSEAEVSWFFWVNLGLIKPGISDHRADEEARVDVLRLMYQYRGFEINGWAIGYETVFQDFKGLLTPDKKEYMDLHPVHVFRIDTTTVYKFTECTPSNQFFFNNKI